VSVSIIIPTLNEEACLGKTLAGLRAIRPHEIIVADGGSQDGTQALAQAADRLVIAPRGRAVQMNLGAASATGEVLLFVHADCMLEPAALDEAETLLRRPGIAAGCYSMRVAAIGLLYRSIDWCATARVCLTGIAYGDQGLFLRREIFRALGGFPSVPFMEDVAMSRRLRKVGRVVVARQPIHVSPRRWQKVGLVRQTVANWVLTGLAAAGVPPDRLAAYYPPHR
jgi:rSAM/selenodomain-associated transferase 2